MICRRVRAPLVGVLVCGLAGCASATNAVSAPTVPPPSAKASPVPSPSAPPSLPPRSVPVSPAGSPTPSFGEGYAVACGGYPAASSILAVLRNAQVISRSTTMVATVGPLCAGGWQYTVLVESGHEPLQVVTQGKPTALTLITAGTDVCTPMVRTQAPAGIQSVAHC